MKTILVIEDDIGPLEAIRDALSGEYNLVEATDVNFALEKLVEDKLPIDLVITDYHLGKTGTASNLMQVIRNEPDERFKKLPVVVVSSDESVRAQLEKQGCIFIRKPMRPVELRRIVKEKLGE
ncbi:MAG: response regulator [Bacteroidota bacterium]